MGVWVAEATISLILYMFRRGYYTYNMIRGTQERIDTRLSKLNCFSVPFVFLERCGNDPSAGSPTETLLRLHLPLNDEV